MLIKTGKRTRDEGLTDDEASSMRRKHLVKGLLTPVVAMPIGAGVGVGAGRGIASLIANVKKLPHEFVPAEEQFFNNVPPSARQKLLRRGIGIGGALGTGAAAVLGLRHLLNSTATKEQLAREKARNSIIDW